MRELSLFSGAGGGLLGTKLLGWRAVGYVERDGYCQAVLEARIRDGLLDPAPIFGDIRDFLADGWADRYRGLVDVVTAGFPCQPFSVAGKRKACGDERNLWPETAEVLERVQPAFALLENVPGLLTARSADGRQYFGTVLGDLAALGFDAEWGVLGAADVGAPHLRKRLWILAYAARDLRAECAPLWAERERARAGGESSNMADADAERRAQCRIPEGQERQDVQHAAGSGGLGSESAWWERDPADEGPESESFVGRVVAGVACRVDRLRALGNGQVPAVVVRAWEELSRRIP